MARGETIYFAPYQQGDWSLYLAGTEQGVCVITLPNESFATLEKWAAKKAPGAVLVEDRERLAAYAGQLDEYFAGERSEFAMPLDLRGTPFQVAVWEALLGVQAGTTQTYSQIAESVGRANAVRAVGAAIGANPVPIVVPCHRVIGKDGSLTGFRGGIPAKKVLLALEGMRVESESE